MSKKINPDFIVIYKSCNCITLSIPLLAFETIGEPNHVIFSETKRIIQIPSIDNKKCCKIKLYNKVRAKFSTTLTVFDQDEFIGNWHYKIEDLTIVLTEKV